MKALFLLASVAMAAQLNIGEVEVGKDFDTPTCSVGLPSTNQIGFVTYFAAPHDTAPVINVNGQVVELELAPGQRSLWDYQTNGEMISTKYVGGKVSVELRGVVKDSCEQGEQGCESTDLTIDTMTVKSGSDEAVMKNLMGSCGV